MKNIHIGHPTQYINLAQMREQLDLLKHANAPDGLGRTCGLEMLELFLQKLLGHLEAGSQYWGSPAVIERDDRLP